ncbi:MAG: DUF3791 domain-containing protein [Prevotellaceae bacterium]|jgi:hypothetical protein|nr:DUF3791 domain-containing protein [Prevotellaceae bacterium]
MNNKELSNEMQFFVYLLEKYAEHKGTTATSILRSFDEMHLTEYVKQMYPQYHIERLENAFADLDRKSALSDCRLKAQ